MNLKVVFFLLASDDPINEADRISQTNTWAKDVKNDVKVFWIRGSNGCDYQLIEDTLFVPCPEGYGNILQKTILASQWLLENVTAELFVRSNTSTYFDLRKIDSVANLFSGSNAKWGGYVDTCEDAYFSKGLKFRFVTGTGIYLNSKSLKKVSEMDFTEYTGVPDDIAISHHFETLKIPPISHSRNNFGSTHVFIPCFQIRAKSSDNYKLASKRMGWIQKYYDANILKKPIIYTAIALLELSHVRFRKENVVPYFLRNFQVIKNNVRRKMHVNG
jgi:hypothetical protein